MSKESGSEAARRCARDAEGPGYWDVNENSAGVVHSRCPGDYWHRTIQRESPVGALEQLQKRHTELRAKLRKRAKQITDQLADGDTPELRAELFERAKYLADLFGEDHAWQLPEQLVDLLTRRRYPQDAEVLAELRAGRHAELLAKLRLDELTTLLTDYHAGLLKRAQQRAEWWAKLLQNIDAVAKKRQHDTIHPLDHDEA